ncbi:hypothetical protein Slin15195_G071040 [Septoria linicola]|uniref:Uncharacterized protein n=1 Tax=Septoria linicola TaxID=215465 RepID=A0A9Q9AWF1_9PEZI|nr:hypothetical protein Slin15195_G071040 [Septoria linicola]
MYLDPEYVVYPPADGWPEITTASMQPFEKIDEVVELLRHLPYVWSAPGRTVHAAGLCQFADWAEIARCITEPPEGLWSKKDQPAFG